MLVKILGIIDLIAAGVFLLLAARVELSFGLILFIGILLFIKSLFGLLQDFGGWIDISCALTLMIAAVFTLPRIILIIFGLLILQKGLVSFL